ncbi:MAG: L,D-transpeptidase family protein [Anaerolineae bacterium]|nr:L,D-transpeptidase family protein [Gloeobacterales cyanobacterium ES-bin-313]
MRQFLLLLFMLCFAAPAAASPVIPAQSTQMILVRSADWQAPKGTLQRYERTVRGWQPVGAPWAIVLGRNGLGWGSGLVPAPGGGEPSKREGDGRSPAGIYPLETAYGYAKMPPAGSRWFYKAIGEQDRCVDDAKAPQYNQIVTISPEQPEVWQSAEVMKRPDDLYRWLIVVAHNQNPPIPGQGSCIFLHVWRSDSSPTAGCTAMAQQRLESLLRWLRPEAKPVLVQLPESTYRTMRKSWKLP